MENFKIYSIKEEYINYLRQFDDRVCDNKSEGTYGRKYTGVVLNISEFLYFAPLTSSVTRKNKKTGEITFKRNFTDVYLFDGNNKLPIGAVKLNNMIPIPLEIKDKVIERVNINNYIYSSKLSDKKYGWLLTKDQRILYSPIIQNRILAKAKELYKNKYRIPKLIELCCDFKLLEQKAIECIYEFDYEKPKELSR